jgi:hypothetical protein
MGLLVALGIQVGVLAAPQLAWILIGFVGAVVLLNCSPYLWALAAVFIAVFSRILVATGPVPQIVNFLHYPFALGGAFLAAVQQNPAERFRAVRQLGLGMLALLFVSAASWLLNGGALLKPLLTWLVFTEPFLVVYIFLKDPAVNKHTNRLWRAALAAIFVQAPLALLQAGRHGIGDHVQGTFVGTGGGHHVAGAVALTGALLLMAKSLFGNSSQKALKYVIGGGALIMVSILSDSKAVFGVFLIGALYLLFFRSDVGIRKIMSVGLVGLALIFLSTVYYPPLALIFNTDRVHEVIDRKLTALEVLRDHATNTPHAWFLGFGPGNTVSRVALLSSDGISKADSPVQLLELSTSQITKEAIRISFTASYAPTATSSAWQVWSSWAGVLGDLGLVGLGVYVWMWWIAWRETYHATGWPGHYSRALILTAVAMGTVYSWLEEPGFITVVGLLTALSLLEGKNLARSDRS